MTKTKFFFAALAMSATALFFGSCDPKENEPGSGDGTAKLASKITFAANEDAVMTFDYDVQNRVSKIDGNAAFKNVAVTYSADSITINGTLTVMNAEEPVGGGDPTYTKKDLPFHCVAALNSSGYATSIKASSEYGSTEIPLTYYNGYLETYAIPYTSIFPTTATVDENGNVISEEGGEIVNGWSTTRFTWTNGNISQLKTTRSTNTSYSKTFTFQYSNYLNKSNIDIFPFLIEAGDPSIALYQMLGLTGKRCANLPVKKMSREGAYDVDLIYTFDNDNYPITVSSSDKEGSIITIEYK